MAILRGGSTVGGYLIADVRGNGASGTWPISVTGSSNRITDTASGCIRVQNPAGASLNVSTNGSLTGAIKIKLPTAGFKSQTMMMFTVYIWNYVAGTQRVIDITGYNYTDSLWYQAAASQRGSNPADITVRFGYDGTSNCVWIGETSSTWVYPNVAVTEFVGGQNNATDAIWGSGWSVSFVTAFDTVTTSVTAARTLNSQNYNTYSPTLTGTGASGSWGINITGSAGSALSATYSGYSNAVTIWDGTSAQGPTSSIPSSGSRSVDLAPNTYSHGVFYEFKNSGTYSNAGNYTGLMTVAPWLGTSASTGDPSYQIAFSPAGVNSTSYPTMKLRAGIDTTWGTWATILHSGNYTNYISPQTSFASTNYTATAGQTSFTITGGYTVGAIQVYVNGYKVNGSDYVATTGTTVVFNSGLPAGAEVEVLAFTAINMGSVTSAVNVTGVVAPANGGTGATGLTGLVYGNGSSAMTVATSAQVAKAASQFRVGASGSISGSQTFDLSAYDEWTFTVSGALTIAFTNAPAAGSSQIVIFRITNGGAFAITWPTSTKFAGGSLGTLTTSGVDMLGVKYDSTTSTYMVFVLGKDMK